MNYKIFVLLFLLLFASTSSTPADNFRFKQKAPYQAASMVAFGILFLYLINSGTTNVPEKFLPYCNVLFCVALGATYKAFNCHVSKEKYYQQLPWRIRS